MNKNILYLLVLILLLTGCKRFNALEKSNDYEYKYEVAKEYFVSGKYVKASQLFGELLAVMKGTANAEESLYLLAMSNFCAHDYESASQYFKKYYQSYPKGMYVEYAHYYAGYSQYMRTPDTRLDQQSTYSAIQEFQNFLDKYPYTNIKDKTLDMIYVLQDKLIEKEYLSAKLYYDLGTYMGNCTSGGSNYEACVVTAQNALKDFPYAQEKSREEFSIMILRAKFHLATQSIEDKREDRYRDAIDEYFSFKNDYPESTYMPEAEKLYRQADAIIKKQKYDMNKD